jgi:hypothetical protein
LAGAGGVVLVVFHNYFSIYQNQAETRRVLVRFFEGGVVLDFCGVEDDEVGGEAFADFAATF